MSTKNAGIDGRLKPSSHQSNNREVYTFSLLRQVVDEMEKPSQHTEQFAKYQYGTVDEESIHCRLYDDAWRSEESDATSLHEVSVDYLDNERSGCEGNVSNAITEVSNDFLSGKRANFGQSRIGDSDESHSDTEFKLLTGMAYVARYPETAAGLSDNDWNPYGTESDTNMSPRILSHNGSGPKLSDSRLSSLTSFNPPLHSTDFNMNTPSAMIYSIPDPGTHMTNINERKTESEIAVVLQPDIIANFSSVSSLSEQTMNQHNPLLELPVSQIDLNKTMSGSDQETFSTKSLAQTHENAHKTEKITFRELGQNQMGQVKQQETKFYQRGTHYKPLKERLVSIDNTGGIIGENFVKDLAHHEEKNDNSRDRMSKKYEPFQEGESLLKREFLGQMVQKTISDIQHFGKSHDEKLAHISTSVDYDLLQRDLQDIQDNLQHSRGPVMKLIINGQTNRAEGQSSDSERDIIPSTTTTPDSQSNKMAWDFAADLGYQQAAGPMDDISMVSVTTKSHRPSDEKKSYNSDGDETRTSASSDKIVDHAAADQALAEMSQILYPQIRNHDSIKDVDQMLFSFRNQRQQIESRYQELNNQGLAEKVYRILTNQDPQSQANGILSEVTAQERELAAQIALKPHNKDFNFSTISSHFDESNQSLAVPDSVRKRLDLSGLSSTDVSKLTDKSTSYVPVGKGFTACDGMAKLLSSQIAKALERTFNHSMEMIVPQRVVQCYPLTVNSELQEKTRKENLRAAAEPEANRGVGTGRPASTSSVITFNTVQNDQNQNSAQSHDDSDSSSGRRREKYRPYRPAGSKEVYYTESDVASVADSATTMESTHFGSDDARGPVLPSSALGSRQDAPNVAGIYGHQMPSFSQDGEILPPIQEKSGVDELEAESSHSYKEDKISVSVRSFRKGDGPSCDTDKGNNAGIQQADFSIHSREDKAESNQTEEGLSGNVRSEFLDPGTKEFPVHGAVAASNIARWENFRDQIENNIQEAHRRTEKKNINQNTRAENLEKTDRKDHLPQQSRYDEFYPTVKQHEHQRLGNHYKRPVNVDSEYSASRTQNEIVTEPLLLTNQSTYKDGSDKLETDQRHNYTQNLDYKRERLYSAGKVAAPSSRYHSAITDKSIRNRFGDSVKPFSPQDPFSQPGQSYQEERLGTLPRCHSEEDLYVRDVQLSPLFHRALSPGLRSAIESRSPVLSRHIERSLRQPPVDRQSMQVHRNLSPPPTFLARERGQISREYTASIRRLPASTTRFNQDRPWSPLLQTRVMSPSANQEHLEQPSQSLHPADSQVMTLRDVTPDSDEREPEQTPVSRRAQLLTQALSQEIEADIQPDIGSLWERFKANNESYESSLSTSGLEAVTDLLLNPSPHLVAQCLKDRENCLIERQIRAEAEREKRRKEQWLQRHRVLQSSSEEEVGVGYAELLAKKEEERMKRRMIRKKKGRSSDAVDANSEVSTKNILDSLFSIPEDASFEHSPNKPSSASKSRISKVSCQPHIIDPNMQKLRERISKQKLKIDKHTLKEHQRIEKLKKLEQLLSAKRNGEISDQALEIQLDELSSTSTPGSENSQEGLGKHTLSHNTTPLSDDSTTAKDSSTEMHAWKTNKQIRIKEMKVKDPAQIDTHRTIKTGKDRNSSSTKGGSQRISKKGSEMSSSQRNLLKLVKEGYLTVEEAYRLAVEREALSDKSSLFELSHEGSSEEFNGSHNSRWHRLYSPYARDDSFYTFKPHYVPKLKSTASKYDDVDVTYKQSWYKQDSEQTTSNRSALASHSDVHIDDLHTENGYIRPRAAQQAQSNANFREMATVSVPTLSGPAWQEDKKDRGRSQSGSISWQSFSPTNHEKKTLPDRSRPGYKISPTRAGSSSPGHTNTKKNRPSSKQPSPSSIYYEKTCSSENEPPLRKKTPESGGIAWHIPLDLHHSRRKEVTAKTNKELPLQERKIVTNTLSEKTAKRSLRIENCEPLQGWQKDREVDHDIWHKPNHPPGISNELWDHIVRNDALASKVNHWEVDPLMDKVQYIFNKYSMDSGTEDDNGKLNKKNFSKMSLQEALLARKQDFISKCKERQKRLTLACEHRKMQEWLRLEREALFMDQERMTAVNFYAHPYSDNLYQPKRRVFSKQEMKELTMKRYKKLPEVLQKKESDIKKEQCKLNRLRMSIFNKKVQREVLRKRCMRQR